MDGTTGDVGTTDQTMASVVSQTGVAHESLWPYDTGQFDVEPPASVKTDAGKAKATEVSTVAATVDAIKAANNRPVPVMFTFNVYAGYEDATSNGGKIAMPSGDIIGGHCNLVVGYNDSTQNRDGSAGAFIVRNSWGTSWGDKGYGYMPYGYASGGYMAACYVITAESEITPPTPTPTPTPTGTTGNVHMTVNVREYQPGRA
jgi:C1A family cysteine protease